MELEKLLTKKIDVFHRFCGQTAILAAGTPEDFNCMTIGWGMMGNVWGHPGSALTVYVSPARYTWEYMEKNDFFTVSFFPPAFEKDVMYLGTHSGRNEDKVARTSLTPVGLGESVGFSEAELAFVCRKVYADAFDIDKVPAFLRDNLYRRIAPHYMYIGFIEAVEGELD